MLMHIPSYRQMPNAFVDIPLEPEGMYYTCRLSTAPRSGCAAWSLRTRCGSPVGPCSLQKCDPHILRQESDTGSGPGSRFLGTAIHHNQPVHRGACLLSSWGLSNVAVPLADRGYPDTKLDLEARARVVLQGELARACSRVPMPGNRRAPSGRSPVQVSRPQRSQLVETFCTIVIYRSLFRKEVSRLSMEQLHLCYRARSGFKQQKTK